MLDSKFAPQVEPRRVQATYTKQIIPRYKGNPLIAALPPSQPDEGVIASLSRAPEFSSNQRDMLPHERCEMLDELLDFMFPLPQHLAIVRQIEGMIRAGYVGRIPHTSSHQAITQNIYEGMQAGKTFNQTAQSTVAQLSSSLIGIPGIGKSTVFKRYLATLPEVIHHEKLNLFQIPFLMFNLPPGSSIKSLCEGILLEIDRLVPAANYYATFVHKGRAAADTLLRNVAYVMNVHCVGILICDEVQNLKNSNKGGQRLMTELVSMCNELKVPIFFIGTNKAATVLTQDFRQARRSVGKVWERIYPDDALLDGINVWQMVMSILWEFQWVKHPVPLTNTFLEAMYHYSQGILDIAIKLFIAVQKLAITRGSEEITIELLATAYREDFILSHPFLAALRSGDASALLQFEDLAPITLPEQSLKKSLTTNVISLSSQTLAPKDIGVKHAVSGGIRQKSTLRKISADKTAHILSIEGRPNDYRRALQYAEENGIDNLKALKLLGMAPHLEDILELS